MYLRFHRKEYIVVNDITGRVCGYVQATNLQDARLLAVTKYGSNVTVSRSFADE